MSDNVRICQNMSEQAGTELCQQAQKKLGLAKLDLHSMKLYLKIEVFHLSYSCGRLPFAKILKLSSKLPRNLGRLQFCQEMEVVFHFPKYLSCLPFSKKMRSSSICLTIEVVFHFPKY